MMMDGNLLVTILRISILKITATLDLVVTLRFFFKFVSIVQIAILQLSD